MQFPLKLRIDESASGHITLQSEIVERSSESSRWSVTLQAGAEGFNGACSLNQTIPTADETPWFFYPGFFHGQGRFDETRATPRLAELNLERWDSPSWDFSQDRGAYPLLLVHVGGRWLGFDWPPHAEVTPGPGFSWQGEQIELRLNLPDNERPRSFTRCRYDAATHHVLRLQPNQRICLPMTCWDFAADKHGYARVQRKVYEALRTGNAPAAVEREDVLAESAAHGLTAWHWVEEQGYMVYSVPFDRTAESIANTKGVTLSWHAESLGFAGGFPVAFGLWWHGARSGNSRARGIAEKLIERYCREGQTEWGFFRSSYHPSQAYTPNGDFPNGMLMGNDAQAQNGRYGSWWLENPSHIHARTTADASYYLARCLALIGADHPWYENWRTSLRKSLEAALSVQDGNGRFGQHYDVDQRVVAQSEGSAGLLWIVTLHQAVPLFEDDEVFRNRLQESMRRAGEGYAIDIENECIYGAPEDVALTPLPRMATMRCWPMPHCTGVLAMTGIYRYFRKPRIGHSPGGGPIILASIPKASFTPSEQPVETLPVRKTTICIFMGYAA